MSLESPVSCAVGSLCVEPIIRPGESYRVCVCVCVFVCVCEREREREIRYNSNLPHLQCMARRGETKKEMKKEGKKEMKKEGKKEINKQTNKRTNESHIEMSLSERRSIYWTTEITY